MGEFVLLNEDSSTVGVLLEDQRIFGMSTRTSITFYCRMKENILSSDLDFKHTPLVLTSSAMYCQSIDRASRSMI